MPPQPAVEHAQPQLQGRQRQRNDEVLDDRPGKRAQGARGREVPREARRRDPADGPRARAARPRPPDRDHPGRQPDPGRCWRATARCASSASASSVTANRSRARRSAAPTGCRCGWARGRPHDPGGRLAIAHDPEHNRNGKQVSDVATFRDHEVAIPISIKRALVGQQALPGCVEAAPRKAAHARRRRRRRRARRRDLRRRRGADASVHLEGQGRLGAQADRRRAARRPRRRRVPATSPARRT